MNFQKYSRIISILVIVISILSACGVTTNIPAVKTPSPLMMEMLQNAEYQTTNYPQKFKLTSGIYFRPPPVKGESQENWFTELAAPVVFGDLNNDGLEDAAVILRSRAGGTGVSVDLAAVINDDGKAVNVASRYLGDRIQVKSGFIQDGIITLDLLIHGPNDGLCCPSLPLTWSWMVVNDNLVQWP
jgi:hypothetical protein